MTRWRQVLSRSAVLSYCSVAIIVGCYRANDLDAGSDVSSDFDARTDCGPARTARDVSVLWVVQSFGLVAYPLTQAREAVGPLTVALQARTSGAIRMAAITADAGPGGIIGNGCLREGRDGVMLQRSIDGRAVGPVLTLAPGEPPEGFVADVRAVIERAGDDECVNQVLESTLRALGASGSTTPLPSHGNYHGDLENAGLLAPGDIALVVIVSDAEDCSWNEIVTDTLPDSIVPCPGSASVRCCPEVLYPSAERYVPALRSVFERAGVDVGFALISGIPEADVSLAEWRARGEPTLCAPGTPSIYAHMPWRLLEVLDAFEPFAVTQPRCDPSYDAIADLVPQIACATGGSR